MAERVRIWLDGVGDPWEAFGDFLEVFPQNKPFQENL